MAVDIVGAGCVGAALTGTVGLGVEPNGSPVVAEEALELGGTLVGLVSVAEGSLALLVGATGVAQICDVALQIRGEAGERQVKRNQIGLAQNLGGSGATCVVSILGAA